jgi:hypothetical protein
MDAAYHLQGIGSAYQYGMEKSTPRIPEPHPSLTDLILYMIPPFQEIAFS